jgi:hypothetical protein
LLAVASFTSASASAPTTARPEKVTLENTLASCVAVEAKEVVSYENLLLLRAVLHSHRVTAECGCKSALLAYRVTDASTGSQTSTGDFLDPAVSKLEAPFLFVLKSDQRARTLGTLTVHVGCGPP